VFSDLQIYKNVLIESTPKKLIFGAGLGLHTRGQLACINNHFLMLQFWVLDFACKKVLDKSVTFRLAVPQFVGNDSVWVIPVPTPLHLYI
jgi:hypothetical protein